MGARPMKHTSTLVLGIIGLVFALITLLLFFAGIALASSTSGIVFWIIIDLVIYLVAASLTITVAFKDDRGIAVAAMVFLILGCIVAFCQLIYCAWAAAVTTIYAAAGFAAVFWILAICGLGMFIVFIWSSVNMCRFVGCCGHQPHMVA